MLEKNENIDIPAVVSRFSIDGDVVSAAPYGSGHINDSFRVEVSGPDGARAYLFQRINRGIFKNPPQMMENISRVTRHIRGRLEARGADQLDRCVLSVVQSRDNLPYCRDNAGEYWRAYPFVEGTRSIDMVTSPDQAFEAARMFGEFLQLLEGLPGPPLYDTIPHFHDGHKRMQDFFRVLEKDEHNRAKSAQEEIRFVREHASMFQVFPALVRSGEMVMRTVHNDTKVNNLLFDAHSGEGLCVIDLETVMPGISLYDFGDLARTVVSGAAEDEVDLSRVEVDLPIFKALAAGFIRGVGDILTPVERGLLVFSCKVMTQIIGLRFLTDYLAGDIYFKVHRPGQNLDRGRVQFQLVKSLIRHTHPMQKIVASI